MAGTICAWRCWRWAWNQVRSTGIVVPERQYDAIEVVDLGLGELATTGLPIVSPVTTAVQPPESRRAYCTL